MHEDEKVFTLEEASALLPWLKEACREAETKVHAMRRAGADSADAQERLFAIIQHWAETVLKLGALPKQPFTIDFNSGHDYFCWEYPEEDIFYRHGYQDGYRGRHRIEE